MIKIKYYDKQERERIGDLKHWIEKGRYQGMYEVIPEGRKQKIRITRKDIIDVFLPEEEP